jgi:phosphoglycolate phosphatase-like HAD superfamily hydrolase
MALIALDADGVLLDYNRAFGMLWCDYFGCELEIVEPKAYHATNFWGVEPPDKGHEFWNYFDHHGWHAMPAMEGAVEACLALAREGHDLVCVTSMPTHRAGERLANLQALGFPIERVIATGSAADAGANPKKEAIEALCPDWFVDDELRKLKDLAPDICLALVDPGHPDCPNAGQQRRHLAMTVPSLAEFAKALLNMPKLTGMRP